MTRVTNRLISLSLHLIAYHCLSLRIMLVMLVMLVMFIMLIMLIIAFANNDSVNAGFFYETIAPILCISRCCLVAISTLTSEINFYTVIATNRH